VEVVVVMAADTMVEKAKRCQHHSTMFDLFLALILKVLTNYMCIILYLKSLVKVVMVAVVGAPLSLEVDLQGKENDP